MGLQAARFTALLFTVLALAPAMAHLLELPSKIGLPPEEYLTVQQIYHGWALLGIVVLGALVSTLALTILSRRAPKAFVPALFGFLCIVATQIVFWTFTFPVNQATVNWTLLPPNWAELRAQWEYSHAASACFNLAAFISVSVSVLANDD